MGKDGPGTRLQCCGDAGIPLFDPSQSPQTPTFNHSLFRDMATNQRQCVSQQLVIQPMSHQPEPAWLIRHRAARITPDSDSDSDSEASQLRAADPADTCCMNLLLSPCCSDR